MKTLLSTVAIGAFTAGGVFAQSATGTDETTVPVQGGQVVVEQEDATVNVTVPDPNVEVTQGQPVVTVEQPQPEITVVVPEPTVRVRQQAPIITVEQAQPQITVVIPEPVVTVMVPKPQVDVDTGEPIIDLDQPEPVVRFVRPEPKITIQEAQPRIEFQQGEASVNVTASEAAEVNVTQEDAQVNVEQGDDANVSVTSEEAEVNVVDGGEADVQVEQMQARVVLEDFNADAEGNMSEEDRSRYQESVKVLPIFDRTAEDLIGRSVATETGEDVGEVDFIGVRGQTLVAIVGVGGFLGMGENEIAVPVEKLILRRDELILPEHTQSQLENMPEYNEAEVKVLEPGIRLAEQLGLD
ncbi:PRC-barrel domain-containing protein [Sulfitobacter sp. S190]|uniref:PRC-barrel domain-containing protein n=1 Tax=Sulfitobacter sp. S190 TaxID=2867022 RepID=UPI0021A84CEF|nr:PRC-barrel domain-containing protein [Sulfitobacter sp. S190]UWR21239.1 PRC-barrel domain-containing protein [Sulfitobacter sp. S190]UWR21249.1 PRC-barrel domain-containing protein [Sulfitobacter sp. S190]